MKTRHTRVEWGLLILAGIILVARLLGAPIPDLAMIAVLGIVVSCFVLWWNS